MMRPITWTLVILAILAGGQTGLCDDPAAHVPPRFRRIFFPADQIQKQPFAGSYLPIDAREFEQLLTQVADRARGAPDPRLARIVRARFDSRLEGEELLVGTARFELDGSAPARVLVLDPCGLALESAEWTDADHKPAEIGVAPDGRLIALAEGSRLECRWSLRGQRNATGAVGFTLSLPHAAVRQFVVDVPTGHGVSSEDCIATKSPSATATPMSDRWTLDLPGQAATVLRLVPPGSARDRRALTLLRHIQSYEFSERGINLSAQLRLDVHGEPLRGITLDLDPGLHLVTARYGEATVPWSATTDIASGRSQARLEFAEPIVGTGRVVQLSAVATLIPGKLSRLPGLRPEGMAWQGGTAELLIPAALVLEQLQTEGCRQSRVSALPAPLLGESLEVQFYRPDATIDVLLATPRLRIPLSSATQAEITAAGITSRVALNFALGESQRRTIELPIAAGWTIDEVTLTPLAAKTAASDWSLEENAGHPDRLKLALAGPTRAVVRGHRLPPAATSFLAAELQMLDLSAADAHERLIGVRSGEGLELAWRGFENLARRDVAALSNAQRASFVQPPAGLVFTEDANFREARLDVQRSKPGYATDIRVDAAVQGDRLTETYTIACTPVAARVDRLLIRFSSSRDVPLEWSLAGGNSGQFSARKLSPGEQTQAGLPAGGEVWELLLTTLDRPGAFELRAQRSVPMGGEMPLALCSVEGATTQRGSLVIRVLGESGLSIQNRRLVGVPAELLAAESYQTTRAAFQYQPARDDLASDAAVTIAKAPAEQAVTGAWAWLGRLESRYANTTTSLHQARFDIQTAGRLQMRIALPAEASPLGASLDGRPLVWARDKKGDGQNIALPPGRAHAQLVVSYTMPAGLPALAAGRVPPVPTLDIPVLAQHWLVWLPADYEIGSADAGTLGIQIPCRTWSERLFSPWGRSAQQHMFNPLVGADWQRAWNAPQSGDTARRVGEQVCADLGTLVGDYLDREKLTWGQLLASLAERQAPQGRTVLVDRDALAAAGLTPQTTVRPAMLDNPLASGQQTLRQAGLIAVAHDTVILLTGGREAAAYAGQLTTPRPDVLYQAGDGPLADELHAAAAGSASRFDSVAAWRTDRTWESPADVGPQLAPGDARGWRSYHLSLTDPATAHIRLAHVPTVRLLAWAVLLASLALLVWKRTPPSIVIAATALAAALALVVPVSYAPLASAVVLGGCLSLALRMSRRPLAPRVRLDASKRDAPAARSSIVQVATMILIAVGLFTSAHALNAADPAPAAPPDAAAQDLQPAASLPSVFVPVDDHQAVVGNKYYVPTTLFEELHRQADRLDPASAGWVIRRGVYQGALARDPGTMQVRLANLRARFDLQVQRTAAAIRIPLARDAWQPMIAAMRLNGQTIQPSWTPAGDALVLSNLPADLYQLELELRPSVQTAEPWSTVDLAIPKLPQSTLELTLPADAPTVELPTALGRAQFDQANGVLRAQLGAVGRLQLRWLAGGDQQAAQNNLEVDELLWLKVRPGTAVLDARFRFRVLGGPVRRVRLLADPRLRLLSPPNPALVAAVHALPGDPQTLELELSRDLSGTFDVDLSFLVTNTSGVGMLELPRLESEARLGRRWVALSVEPALQSRVQAGEDVRPLDVGDFATAWGASDLKAQSAYRIPRGEPLWRLAAQPNEPQLTIEQSQAISVGRQNSRLRLDAAMSISGGVLVQLGLQGPPGMAVERVQVKQDNLDRVARWSVDGNGRITVFLTAPLDGQQQLAVDATWPQPQAAGFAAPLVRVLAAETRKNLLSVYRQPAVQVAVRPAEQAAAADRPAAEAPAGFGALAAALLLAPGQEPPQLEVSPNNPHLKLVTLTAIAREDDHWCADLHCHADVSAGVADTLQFLVPPQWVEPLRIEPAMRTQLVALENEQRKLLIVSLPKPLSGQQDFRIRGRVALSPGDRLGVPDLQPLHADEVERFVLLPQHSELQQVTWETLGLVRATLPPALAARLPAAQSTLVYQVAGDRFAAMLKTVQRPSSQAEVALVDVHLAWLSDGSYRGVAAFDVEPRGATHCTLEMPGECELISATVEQLPASLTKLPERGLRIALGPRQLPQRIELVYRGAGALRRGAWSFAAPRLADLKVGQTLWTVYAPAEFGPAQPRESNWQATRAQQEFQRLESVTALVSLSPELVAEHLPEEVSRWFGPWQARYLGARAALRRSLAGTQASTNPAVEELAARKLDARQVGINARLGGARSMVSRPNVPDAAVRLTRSAGPGATPTTLIVPGASAMLELRYPQATISGVWGRWLMATLLVILGGLLASAMVGRALAVFSAWQVVAVLAALAWLWLAPSLAGFSLLLLVVGGAALRAWRVPDPARSVGIG